jgi:hypothetical protein
VSVPVSGGWAARELQRLGMPHPLSTGLLSGLAATVPMTAVMELLHRQLPAGQRYPLPPRQISQRMTRKVGVEGELDEDEHFALALASHFGYGAATGAIYGVVEDRVRPHVERAAPGAPPVAVDAAMGVGYGLLVWAGSYLGWLPAAGIMKPATRHPAPRNALMIAAHVVFGGTLGVLTGAMRRRER